MNRKNEKEQKEGIILLFVLKIIIKLQLLFTEPLRTLRV